MTVADVYLARVNRLLDRALEAGSAPRSGARRKLDLLNELLQLTPPASARCEYEHLVSLLSVNLNVEAEYAEKIERNVAIAAAAQSLVAVVSAGPQSDDATRIRELMERKNEAAEARRVDRLDATGHLVEVLNRVAPPRGMDDLHRELIGVASTMHDALRRLVAAAGRPDRVEALAAFADYEGAIVRLHDLWDRMEARARQYPP